MASARGESGWGKGHEAGYQWAAARRVTHDSDCDSRSESFNEGCRTYVAEQAAAHAKDNEESGNG